MPMALDPNPAPSTSLLKRRCARIGFGKKDGYVPEDVNYCSTDALHTLEGLNDTRNINDYMTNTRPANCYMSSESDYQLVQWLLADTGGIAYFGFSYYVSNADLLTVVRVASDRILGVVDTADAKVEPSIYTITDGSYSVYKRQLFMNVDNTAWDRVHPYLSYGFSEAGQRQVSEVLRVGHEEYQQTAEACSHPLAPCKRVLVDARMGDGKGKVLIATVGQQFADGCKKLPIFPTKAQA